MAPHRPLRLEGGGPRRRSAGSVRASDLPRVPRRPRPAIRGGRIVRAGRLDARVEKARFLSGVFEEEEARHAAEGLPPDRSITTYPAGVARWRREASERRRAAEAAIGRAERAVRVVTAAQERGALSDEAMKALREEAEVQTQGARAATIAASEAEALVDADRYGLLALEIATTAGADTPRGSPGCASCGPSAAAPLAEPASSTREEVKAELLELASAIERDEVDWRVMPAVVALARRLGLVPRESGGQ